MSIYCKNYPRNKEFFFEDAQIRSEAFRLILHPDLACRYQKGMFGRAVLKTN